MKKSKLFNFVLYVEFHLLMFGEQYPRQNESNVSPDFEGFKFGYGKLLQLEILFPDYSVISASIWLNGISDLGPITPQIHIGSHNVFLAPPKKENGDILDLDQEIEGVKLKELRFRIHPQELIHKKAKEIWK